MLPASLRSAHAPTAALRAGGGAARAVGVALLAACVLAAGAAPAGGGERESQEYGLKARFLLNFALFVTWPPAAFPDAASPFVLGILGEDPFGSDIDTSLRGADIGGRRVRIARVTWNDDLRACHVLFVSRSERSKTARLLERLAGAPVLTVGDEEVFAARGGMIAFRIEGNRVRFDVNPHSARQHGLVLASQMLELARVVGQ